MPERVGIVAVAQTKYAGSRRDVRVEELANEAVRTVLGETGLAWTEDGKGIDCSCVVCDEFWEGQTLAEIKLQDIAGGYFRDSTKVAQDGAQAVLYGMATILSGHADTILLNPLIYPTH